MATKADGIFVHFGIKNIINIVNKTKPSIIYKSIPCIHVITPSEVSLNRFN